MGLSRRMVRQSQGSGAGEMNKARDQEQGQQRIKTGTGSRNRIQGPRRNAHQGRVCRSGHPLNTSV
ncbi:unnamed protein product [Staurois parvus]|uniref:Uncharacterized protein n=1 Tax=Staurois parvus TaxID=386267 RepID=A0ABN9H5T4_9NEOB|nr:unnamed protein product [Staurois parvus]